jgi:Arc/MetJ family transcription regulator
VRTNIVLDDDLVDEALTLTGAKTKSELVRLAIVELIRTRKRKNLLDLAGQIQFRDDFDHKKDRELRDGAD